MSIAPRLFGRPGQPREWTFFWHDPRPGWDKKKRTRHIFALDHKFKLYSDGRFFDLISNLAEQSPLTPSQLSPPERIAHAKRELHRLAAAGRAKTLRQSTRRDFRQQLSQLDPWA